MRTFNKYGRRLTDRQCVLCQRVDSIFGFTFYAQTEGDVCHRCARDAVSAAMQPKYPLPTKIGEVYWYVLPDVDNPRLAWLEVVISDVDEGFDPQRCFATDGCDVETDDYGDESPNHR